VVLEAKTNTGLGEGRRVVNNEVNLTSPNRRLIQKKVGIKHTHADLRFMEVSNKCLELHFTNC
jgi:hypothetical protein